MDKDSPELTHEPGELVAKTKNLHSRRLVWPLLTIILLFAIIEWTWRPSFLTGDTRTFIFFFLIGAFLFFYWVRVGSGKRHL